MPSASPQLRLLAVPALSNVSGAQRIGDLIARLRAAAVAEVPNAQNQHQIAAGRERLAAAISADLEALGFGNEARALQPSTPSAAATAATPGGFVNLGA